MCKKLLQNSFLRLRCMNVKQNFVTKLHEKRVSNLFSIRHGDLNTTEADVKTDKLTSPTIRWSYDKLDTSLFKR